MDILTLCTQIDLQPQVKKRVLAFAQQFHFDTVAEQLRKFTVYERMREARAELQAILAEDADNIKMLTCMLKASADIYAMYRQKDIPDTIYFDTMKCYPRFIDETYQITGRLYFDRDWWTTRQAGGHLFRIGALEYEMQPAKGSTAISIHIPSGAGFSPAAVSQSLTAAKAFFRQYYPPLEDAEYYCHSWLLDRQLQAMLDGNSNILHFQKRFELLEEGKEGTEFMRWVFHSQSADYSSLPEKTTLQRKMKTHLLAGGVIRSALGRLK